MTHAEESEDTNAVLVFNANVLCSYTLEGIRFCWLLRLRPSKTVTRELPTRINMMRSLSTIANRTRCFEGICHASASYDVHLDTLHGVNTMNITNFTNIA